MADAVISVVVERVAAILEDQIRYKVNLVRGVEKEVLDVSDKLKTIRDVLDDAEKRGAKEQSVKRWLKKLEATAYKMDDILDEWKYTLLKHNVVASAKQKDQPRLGPNLKTQSKWVLYFMLGPKSSAPKERPKRRPSHEEALPWR